MIKYFCDICEKEIDANENNAMVEIASKEYKFFGKGNASPQFKIIKQQLCKECTDYLEEFFEKTLSKKV